MYSQFTKQLCRIANTYPCYFSRLTETGSFQTISILFPQSTMQVGDENMENLKGLTALLQKTSTQAIAKILIDIRSNKDIQKANTGLHAGWRFLTAEVVGPAEQ